MDEVLSSKLSVRNSFAGERIQFYIKRMMDVMIAGVGLLLLMPIMVLIALAIKLDSPGPVIYKHRRVGKDAQPFDLFKFRSMVSGGNDSNYEKYLQGLIESSKKGVQKPYVKMETDPRVTRVGKVLRKYYLDEFPQLWNILIGDMSLVGPRPHVQFEVDNYPVEFGRRLSVKPGATGIWQVHGKADCSFIELLQLDLEYIDHWSLIQDIQLITRTIIIMLQGGEDTWTRMEKRIPK